MNAKNSEMRVINHKNANQNIQNRVKKDLHFSDFNLQKARNPHSGYRIFYYIDKDRNIVGFITLKIFTHYQHLKSLVDLVSDKKFMNYQYK